LRQREYPQPPPPSRKRTKTTISMVSMSLPHSSEESGSPYFLREHHHKLDEDGYLFTSAHIRGCLLLPRWRFLFSDGDGCGSGESADATEVTERGSSVEGEVRVIPACASPPLFTFDLSSFAHLRPPAPTNYRPCSFAQFRIDGGHRTSRYKNRAVCATAQTWSVNQVQSGL
jgi:hypothetical protein